MLTTKPKNPYFKGRWAYKIFVPEAVNIHWFKQVLEHNMVQFENNMNL